MCQKLKIKDLNCCQQLDILVIHSYTNGNVGCNGMCFSAAGCVDDDTSEKMWLAKHIEDLSVMCINSYGQYIVVDSH